jgi:hypothetical protein
VIGGERGRQKEINEDNLKNMGRKRQKGYKKAVISLFISFSLSVCLSLWR